MPEVKLQATHPALSHEE
uniref:Uncharacterized protein n=1 Tax=Rhizophora mucronata TaxID=61149 RepID=A0A2P2P2P9_RHIMU